MKEPTTNTLSITLNKMVVPINFLKRFLVRITRPTLIFDVIPTYNNFYRYPDPLMHST